MSILVVESFLKSIIDAALKDCIQDVSIVDNILRHFDPEIVERFKQMLVSDNDYIGVTIGFPRPNSHLPTYCILLGGEQEQVEGIGNDGAEWEVEADDTETVDLELDADGNIKLMSPMSKVIELSYAGVPIADYEVVDYSRGIIRVNDASYVEGDILTLEYRPMIAMAEESTLFRSQYRIESWSTNGDVAVCMYHLVKHILLKNRLKLTSEGLRQQSISGADFEPMPKYFPEFVYRRALIIDVTDEVSWKIDKTFTEGNIDSSVSHN